MKINVAYREKILSKLNNLSHIVEDSLIYQVILYCDKITFTGNIINIYATKRNMINDLFNGRVIMKIILVEGRIQIWLPSYSDSVMFQCSINSNYLKSDNSIRLTNIFVNIYNSIFSKLSYPTTNIGELLFITGIKHKAVKIDYLIRIYNEGNFYSDLSSRLTPQFDILIEDIIYFKSQYSVNRVLQCFTGLVLGGEINDEIAKGIVYLKSTNEITIDELNKFPSLKYVDIICDSDMYLYKEYNSLRINNVHINGNSPYDSFIKQRM